MNKINVLLLDLSDGDSCCNSVINELTDASSKINLEIHTSLELVKEIVIDQGYSDLKISEFTSYDIVLVWVNKQNSDILEELIKFKDELRNTELLEIIIVLGFNEEVQQTALKSMLNGIYAFAQPFNQGVLIAYIESIALEVKNSKKLLEFKNYLLEASSITEILDISTLELKTNPIIGYNRVTISLIDLKEIESPKRYLVKYNSDSIEPPNRSLMKDIINDKLIANVVDNDVYIIDNLNDLRVNNKEELNQLGWEDCGVTSEINSWVGLCAKHQGKPIAIITLDHKSVDHYSLYKDKLTKFLKGFGDIFANSIKDFFEARNSRTIQEVTREIGDVMDSKELLRLTLKKLKIVFECDNCTYFKVSSNKDSQFVNEPFLIEWVSAKESEEAKEISPKIAKLFNKGEGIVGAVLSDSQSRIIPVASDCQDFKQGFNFSGFNLSMLAVPVIPKYNEGSILNSRIIGIINCYRKDKTDHFTPYDRDLVESLALIIATVVERTITLEYFNNITSQMNSLLYNIDKNKTNFSNEDKTNLLKSICEHALTITSAKAAVIHRLKSNSEKDSNYILTETSYTFPEGSIMHLPRLDGTGATDEVIKQMKTVEFSESKNSEFFAEEFKEENIKYQIIVPLFITSKEGNKKELIGTLSLKKIDDIPFSKVELFALELFASQAANTIYNQEFLAQRFTWSDANQKLVNAIDAIALKKDLGLLLKDIAKNAYLLVAHELDRDRSNIDSFSYVAFFAENDSFDYKAAYPEYVLSELDSARSRKENAKKKGITMLAKERQETILISDLHLEKEKNTIEWQYYICARNPDKIRSELAVPIKVIGLDSKTIVIGVINLEHENPYAFTQVHKEIMEHFARQIAFGFQNKNLLEYVEKKKNNLIRLQKALTQIIESPSDKMLFNATVHTREALDVYEVIIVQTEEKNYLFKRKAYNDTRNSTQSFVNDFSFKEIETKSQEVYNRQEVYCFTTENNSVEQDEISDNQKSFFYCIPFPKGKKLIGVMWIIKSEQSETNPFNMLDESNPFILYKKDFRNTMSDYIDKDEIEVYLNYVNQISLAFDSSVKSSELESKLDNKISKVSNDILNDYKQAKWQSNAYFSISLVSSISGIILILIGLSGIITSNNKEPKQINFDSGFPAFIGVFMQAITVLAFDRGKAANNRMDDYHKEILSFEQLQILISSTHQLDKESSQKMKQFIIESTANAWLESLKKGQISKDINEKQV